MRLLYKLNLGNYLISCVNTGFLFFGKLTILRFPKTLVTKYTHACSELH